MDHFVWHLAGAKILSFSTLSESGYSFGVPRCNGNFWYTDISDRVTGDGLGSLVTPDGRFFGYWGWEGAVGQGNGHYVY